MAERRATSGKVPVAAEEAERSVALRTTASMTLPALPLCPARSHFAPPSPSASPTNTHIHAGSSTFLGHLSPAGVAAPRVDVSEPLDVMSKLHVGCIQVHV